ncbi:MAG: hypothetical protein K9L98_01455 [Candidatus Pacebacteria bacterium]|nr:hypothetical protein [Candidatus Paceibacterota bacterium]MCF7862659.1 hypothetical protein [Candidatus Paceibacterota bacterium]
MSKYIKYIFLVFCFVFSLSFFTPVYAVGGGDGGVGIYPRSANMQYGTGSSYEQYLFIQTPNPGPELTNFLNDSVGCDVSGYDECTGTPPNTAVSCEKYGYGVTNNNGTIITGCDIVFVLNNGNLVTENKPSNITIFNGNVEGFSLKMNSTVTQVETFTFKVKAYKRAWRGDQIKLGQKEIDLPVTVTAHPSGLMVAPSFYNTTPGETIKFLIKEGPNISHTANVTGQNLGDIFDLPFVNCYFNNNPQEEPLKCMKIKESLLSQKVSTFPYERSVTFTSPYGLSKTATIKVDCPLCIVLSPEPKTISIGESFMFNLVKKNGNQVNTYSDYVSLFQGDCQQNGCINAIEVSGKNPSTVKKFNISLGTTAVNIVSLPTTTAGDYTLRVQGVESEFPEYKTVGYAKIHVLETPASPYLKINWSGNVNTGTGGVSNTPVSSEKKITFSNQNSEVLSFNLEKLGVSDIEHNIFNYNPTSMNVNSGYSTPDFSGPVNGVVLTKNLSSRSGKITFNIKGKDQDNNNILSNSLVIDVKIPPDLRPDPVTFTPTASTINKPVKFSAIVKNIGGETTGASFNSFFQITDQDPSSNPELTQQRGVKENILAKLTKNTKKVNAQTSSQFPYSTPAVAKPPLAPGGSLTVDVNHTFTQSGTYWVRVCTDKQNILDLGRIVESDEDNNCSHPYSKIVIGSLPDLIPGGISPTTFQIGPNASINTSVKNIGGVATGASFKAFLQLQELPLSAFKHGAQIVNALIEVDLPSFDVNALNAGEEKLINLSNVDLRAYSEGGYKMRLCVDKENRNSAGTITEVDEGNNCGAWTTIALADNPMPDLVISSVSPKEATVNQALNLTAVATNQGLKATGGGFDGFMQVSAINPDPSGEEGIGAPSGQGNSSYNSFAKVANAQGGGETAAITDLTSYDFKNLGVNSSETMTTSHTFNAVGTYWLRACVDKKNSGDDGKITESLENNNCSGWGSISVKVGPSPDLTASYTGPTNFSAEQVANLSGSISNIGSANISTAFPNFFQVADHNPDNAEGNITDLSSVQISSLSAGTNQSITKQHTFDNNGSYWIRVCADKSSSDNNGEITESDETNNCGAWVSVNVGEAGVPFGNLSATGCIIQENSGSCDISLTWSTGNLTAEADTAVTVNPPRNTVVSTDTSGTKVKYSVKKETYGFFLYHNGVELDTSNASADCASNLYWDDKEEICKKGETIYSSSLSVSPSWIAFDATSTLSWSSMNAIECNGDGFDTKGATEGSSLVGPFQTEGQHVYTLYCTGEGTRFAPKSVTLNVTEDGGTAKKPTYKEQ